MKYQRSRKQRAEPKKFVGKRDKQRNKQTERLRTKTGDRETEIRQADIQRSKKQTSKIQREKRDRQKQRYIARKSDRNKIKHEKRLMMMANKNVEGGGAAQEQKKFSARKDQVKAKKQNATKREKYIFS